MGNKDGIMEAIEVSGTNELIHFQGGYFSFAHENEIALILLDESKLFGKTFYILNCDWKLWEEVQKEVKKTSDKGKLIKLWIKKSKKYEISDWSKDFNKLGKKDE